MISLLEKLAARFLRNRAVGYCRVTNLETGKFCSGWIYGKDWFINFPDVTPTVATPDTPGPYSG